MGPRGTCRDKRISHEKLDQNSAPLPPPRALPASPCWCVRCDLDQLQVRVVFFDFSDSSISDYYAPKLGVETAFDPPLVITGIALSGEYQAALQVAVSS